MLTRNKVEKNPSQQTGVNRITDPYDKTRRQIKLGKAKSEYDKTGDFSKLNKTSAKIEEKTLGGSAENFNIKQTREGFKDVDYSTRVEKARQAYEINPGEGTSTALKTEMETGFDRYSKESSRGLDITSAIRNVDINERERDLFNIATNWANDPEVYKEEYKEALNKQISFYGEDSANGVKLKEKLRTVEEESLMNKIRNAQLEYDQDPVNNFDSLSGARKKLAEFYGSSEDGYYAKQALNNLDETEQNRLDTSASTDFETGKLGYDGFSSYLNASMSKYPEGSEEYMKYYKASSDLKFGKELDDLIRLQYSQPKGKVQQSMKTFQTQFEEGSSAFNTIQDNVDQLEEMIRYDAYTEMIKGLVKERQEDINDLNVKSYTLEQDYVKGEISKSKYEKKFKEYNNKISYLSDSNTLPQFEIYKEY